MATKSQTKAQETGYTFDGLDDAPTVVEPIIPADFRKMLMPARTLGADEEHFKTLDGAMDAAFSGGIVPNFEQSVISSFTTFVGYGVLQQLAQDALIRLCIQTRTDEMLRNWIEIECEDPKKKETIEQCLKDLKVKDRLSQALTLMGLMGGAYIFIDTSRDHDQLADPLNKSPNSAELTPEMALSLRVIDPIFTTPTAFNSVNPLAGDFYAPNVFYVMWKKVHKSRLIRFVENEVPDLLKPSYNFLGIPQAQLLSDYVTHFRKNREETNRLLHKFSTSIVKGNLKEQLYHGKSTSVLSQRVQLFAKYRDNSGVALLDKDSEDFVQVNTPISGVTDIVRQSLEFVVSMNQSGVVKTLGYSPAGFNATGESDIKLQADLISTRQDKILREPIEEILRLVQLHCFGQIDPSISFTFNPVDPDDELDVATVQKTIADTAAIYLDRGVLTEDEVREALRTDDKSVFKGVEGDAPGAPVDPFAQMSDPTEVINGGAVNEQGA